MPTDDERAKILHRVGQLVGMTASASEEEARSMALAACTLIRKHGLAVVFPDASESTPATERGSTSPADGSLFGGAFGEWMDAFFRGVNMRERVRAAAEVAGATIAADFYDGPTPVPRRPYNGFGGRKVKRRRRR